MGKMKAKSDLSLLKDIRKFGMFDPHACLQCGSCTLACDLSTDSASFPRIILRYALLGIKDRFKTRLEPWLCHDCGDCSILCPRDTEPARGMETLRRYLTAQYDWTGISSRLFGSRIWQISLMAFTGLLVLFLAVIYHLEFVGMNMNELILEAEPLGMQHMFNTIGTFTYIVFFLSLFFLITNAFRMYWITMRKNDEVNVPFSLYITQLKTFFTHALTQKKFRDCSDKTHRIRRIKHMILMAGLAVSLFLMVFFLSWFQTDAIYPVIHPQRWLGYFAAVTIAFGALDILVSRIRKRKLIHKFSDLKDLMLPVVLLLTVLSGLAVHVLRYAGFPLGAHFTYAVHLAIAVPLILIEIPFGKWSHMIYRPLAIYFHTLKEKALLRQENKKEDVNNAA